MFGVVGKTYGGRTEGDSERAMLMAKCKKFENDLKVPENERMISNGWISKFYKAYMWIISQT